MALDTALDGPQTCHMFKTTRCTKHDWQAHVPSTARCSVCGKRMKWNTINQLVHAREQAKTLRALRAKETK